jgi:hypothetical protein
MRAGRPALYVGICAACVCLGAAMVLAVDVDGFWFILLLSALTISTVAVLLYEGRRRDGLSPLGLAAIFYLLGYGSGALYFWLSPNPSADLLEELYYVPSRDELTTALAFALGAWLLFLIGYAWNPFRVITRALPRVSEPRSMRSVLPLVVPMLIAGWIARASLISSDRYFHRPTDEVVATGTSYLTYVIGSLPLVAAAIVGAYHYLGRAPRGSRRYRNLYWLLVLIEAAWVVPTGSRGQVIGVLVLILVVRYYASDRGIPRRTVVVTGILVVFVVFPFALAYRNDATDYRTSTTTALGNAADRTFSEGPGRTLDKGFAATFSRFSDVVSLSEAIRVSRSAHVRRQGETIRWLGEGFVPRAVLPNKADPGLFGNEFGRNYNFIGSGDYVTSIAVTHPGEAYLNLGLLGVILMMPFAGALYRVLADYLGGRRGDPIMIAVYAAVAWPIMSSHETILANGYAGVIKLLVAYSIVIAVILFVATTATVRGASPRAALAGPRPAGARQ